MNRLNWFFVVLLSVTTVFAQKGIDFRSESIDQVFQNARRTGKPVFVEIYSPDCHVCQSFMPTLADPRVGKFYNEKFVSKKLELMNQSTQDWLKAHRLYVPSLPLFLYFDGQQTLIHYAMSNNSADEVIRHGTVATDPKKRAQTFRQRFEKGEREANFLIDYGMYAKVTTDTVGNLKAMEAYAKQQPASTYANQTNWLVLQKLIMDSDNPLAVYFINNQGAYKQYGPQPVHDVAENIIMSSLYCSRAGRYEPSRILRIRDQLVKIGVPPQVAANRTLLPEVGAYFRAKQTEKATARMDKKANTAPLTVPEFIYICRYFNKNSPDPADVPTVIKWSNKALGMKPTTNDQADLYYEQAEASRRAGKKADGLKAAQKSLEMAKTAKMDTKRNTTQLSKLK